MLVAASGNEDGPVGFPAAFDEVIAVGAVNARRQKAFYSNFGPELDLVAPGGDSREDVDGDGRILTMRVPDPHGGYKNLLSYQKAEIVYDATVVFCDRFIDRRSRTHDQMVQAARSGQGRFVDVSMTHQVWRHHVLARSALESSQRMNLGLAAYIVDHQPRPLIRADGGSSPAATLHTANCEPTEMSISPARTTSVGASPPAIAPGWLLSRISMPL